MNIFRKTKPYNPSLNCAGFWSRDRQYLKSHFYKKVLRDLWIVRCIADGRILHQIIGWFRDFNEALVPPIPPWPKRPVTAILLKDFGQL